MNLVHIPFDAIEKLAQDAREQYLAAAVDGDAHAEAVVHDARTVSRLVGILRYVQVQPGDVAILNGKVESLKLLVDSGRAPTTYQSSTWIVSQQTMQNSANTATQMIVPMRKWATQPAGRFSSSVIEARDPRRA
jgi:hypothetical protein